MELNSSVGDHNMASQPSDGFGERSAALEASESSSKLQSDYSPLLAGEEREAFSYEGENPAQTLVEMEETLSRMERIYAAYVRHDTYGTMGRGGISIWEKALLVVALLFFVPVRVFLLLAIVMTYYIICKFCTMFRAPEQHSIGEMTGEPSTSSSEPEGERNGGEEQNGSEFGEPTDGGQENYAHLTGLRRFIIILLGQFLSRSILFVLGFYWIKVTRKDREQDEALLKEGLLPEESRVWPSAIVSNHISYIDVLYHMSASFPSFVAKRSVARLPLVGLISKCLGCVYVQREDKASDFKGVAGIVKRRLQVTANDKSAPLMMLFPEGTTTNGFYLLPFKTGAFISGTPVQPVILKYPYRRFSSSWDTISGVRHIVLLLCQFINWLEVIWLPVYIPSEKEKSDPKLYASNVRILMALEGGLLKSDIGLQEKRIYHSFLNEYIALKGSA